MWKTVARLESLQISVVRIKGHEIKVYDLYFTELNDEMAVSYRSIDIVLVAAMIVGVQNSAFMVPKTLG